MASRNKVITSGAVAAIIAVALIIAAIYIPGSGLLNRSTSSATSTTSGSQGSFSVLMTDPPTVPSGVTALFMTYNKVGVHIADQGNDSGWNILSQSGTIDLMQAINVSQTIATASLTSGSSFNALGFNVTSVVVTYNGVNYTADLVYGQNRLFVPIPGGISIASEQTQAVMIDMTPKVILLGTPSSPTFAFLPSARAYVVPSNAIPAEAHYVGERHDLEEDSWWNNVLRSTGFGITNVQLAPNGLSITADNTGNSSVVFHFAAITATSSVSGGEMPPASISDIFIVEPDGSLAQLNGTTKDQMETEIAAAGYILAPGQSVTLTYSGPIGIGLIVQSLMGRGEVPIAVGSTYVVRLYGNDFVAAAATTAIASIGSSTTSTTMATSSTAMTTTSMVT